MTEVVVHDAEMLAFVAAKVARAGATPVLEDPRVDARRGIGGGWMDENEKKEGQVRKGEMFSFLP